MNPPQSRAEAHAQRGFKFVEKEFWACRPLAVEMHRNWDEAAVVISDGSLEIWVRRGLENAAAALKAKRCRFLYLPPHSPDLNPIELAFSKLKAHLRRIGARTFDQMFDALAQTCDLFTPEEWWNYFCEAGYGSN